MGLELLDLPYELLEAILVQVEPRDLGSLRCCRVLDTCVKGNGLLFKQIYLAHFVRHPFPAITPPG